MRQDDLIVGQRFVSASVKPVNLRGKSLTGALCWLLPLQHLDFLHAGQGDIVHAYEYDNPHLHAK